MKKTLIKFNIIISLLIITNLLYSQDGSGVRRRLNEIISRRKKPIIAIYPLKRNNISKKKVETIQDSIITHLVQTKKYKVVERSQIEKIMKEIQLSASDLADRRTAIRIGKLISARGMVIGKVSVLEGKKHISLRLVDVQTSEIIRSAEVSFYSDRYIPVACKIVTYKLANAYLPPEKAKIPDDDKRIDTFNINLTGANGAIGYFGVDWKIFWLVSVSLKMGYSEYTDDENIRYRTLPLMFSVNIYPFKSFRVLKPYLNLSGIVGFKIKSADESIATTKNTFMALATIGAEWKLHRVLSLFIEAGIIYNTDNILFTGGFGLKVWLF